MSNTMEPPKALTDTITLQDLIQIFLSYFKKGHDDIQNVREDMRGDIRALSERTDRQMGEMREDMQNVREDMRGDVRALSERTDRQMGEMRGDVQNLREDMQNLRNEVQSVREDMRGDVRALSERTDRQMGEMRIEFNEKIEQVHSKMSSNFKWLVGIQITSLLAVLTSILAILLTSA